jgi:DNA-binding HxlR family transcriptional regulator
MLGRAYESQNCSAARTLEVVGERWSMLILRDALVAKVTRFRDFQRRLGVAPSVLKVRLDSFVAAGLMERRCYSESAEWHEYILTDKGRDLESVLMALTGWGDRWSAPDGPPVIYTHADCGGDVVQQPPRCEKCGQSHDRIELATRPGPGARGARPAQGSSGSGLETAQDQVAV